MAEPNSYEEQRRRQVEDNKRKLEELRLHRLFAAVREAAVEPMPNKKLKPRNTRPPPDAPIRRSGRIARLPKQPDYHIGRANCSTRAVLPKPVPVYGTNEERAYAITKAEGLRDQLDSHYPSFVRPLNLSYVTGGNGLGIPPQFSKRYLPLCNEMIFLVDEEGVEYHVLYHVRGSRLSSTGWKPFAIENKLAEADCLVFQLVERTKFKVYIIRASSYYAKDH